MSDEDEERSYQGYLGTPPSKEEWEIFWRYEEEAHFMWQAHRSYVRAMLDTGKDL